MYEKTTKYEQALKHLPIGTINRLYELEKEEFTDFFYNGVSFVMKGYLIKCHDNILA